mmetsp:Transcript_88470/g.223453  ORF Transcript_88470/g.223453 Transcript_88470/m.223453 type:complete len:296 (+) Transcript_88470:65-952(+)
MAAEQPKKPAGGAYGRFLAEKREEIKASLPAGHKITDVAKKAGELFKALSEDDKTKYQGAFEKAMAEYKEALEKFKAEGGEVTRKSKRGKEPRAKPSPDQPKKPAGGAYGRFLAEKREEIKGSLPAGHKITDVAKKAGELFKALSEEDKKKYQDAFEKAMSEYKEALEKFKAGGGEVVRGGKAAKAPKDGDDSGKPGKPENKRLSKMAMKTGKAKAAPKGKAAAGKRGRPADVQGIHLSETDLKKARDLGYESQIQNLSKRPEVVDSGKKGADLLAALKDSNGLVNAAKRALLGA